MPLEFSCGQCGRQLRVPDDAAGKMTRCPACGNIQRAPTPDVGSAPAPPSAEPINPFAERSSLERSESPLGPTSSKPFADQTTQHNPYAAPSYPGNYGQPYVVDEAYARAKVQGPAMALMILFGLELAFMVFAGAIRLIASATGHADAWDALAQFLFFIPLFALIVHGAYKMYRLENYNLAIAAAIFAMLPCSGCCILGVPIGIWALIVLQDPRVRAAFH